MTEEAVATESPVELEAPYAPGSVWVMFAIICLVIGALLAAFGLYQAFTYDSSSRYVGGDAYNLQIIASRGLVLVSAGGVLVLGAIAQLLLALRAQLASRNV